MDIRISVKNFDLSPEAESYIEKKFARLERHLKPISDASLEVSRTSARALADRITAQMTLKVNGYTLRGQEKGVNLFAAIDGVTDVMDRQIRRFKGKVYKSYQARKSAKADRARLEASTAVQEVTFDDETPSYEELGSVVRTKRFRMEPKTVDEAILEMELLSHDFFLFYNAETNEYNNAETNEYNVAYRRSDGDYGVIEPQLA